MIRGDIVADFKHHRCLKRFRQRFKLGKWNDIGTGNNLHLLCLFGRERENDTGIIQQITVRIAHPGPGHTLAKVARIGDHPGQA